MTPLFFFTLVHFLIILSVFRVFHFFHRRGEHKNFQFITHFDYRTQSTANERRTLCSPLTVCSLSTWRRCTLAELSNSGWLVKHILVPHNSRSSITGVRLPHTDFYNLTLHHICLNTLLSCLSMSRNTWFLIPPIDSKMVRNWNGLNKVKTAKIKRNNISFK